MLQFVQYVEGNSASPLLRHAHIVVQKRIVVQTNHVQIDRLKIFEVLVQQRRYVGIHRDLIESV